MSFHSVRTSKWTSLSITLIFQYGAKKPLSIMSPWYLFSSGKWFTKLLKQVTENEISTNIVLELRQKLLPDDKVISKGKFKSTINYFHYYFCQKIKPIRKLFFHLYHKIISKMICIIFRTIRKSSLNKEHIGSTFV